jgi:acyl-CoA synthetase (NDP forming)
VASAPPEHFREAIGAVAADPGIDALIVIFIPPLATKSVDAAEAIVEAARSFKGDKPVLTVFMSSRGVPASLRTADVQIPSFAFPEDAAIALARAARYGEWRSKPRVSPPAIPDLRRDEAAALVAVALERGEGWLTPVEVHALLSAYGLPLVRQRVAATPAAAGDVARDLGTAVALKAIAPDLLHKTELGAVRLGLETEDQVREAAEEMQRALTDAGLTIKGFLVQEMAPKGVEMLIGVVHDQHFGPVVACGAGGVLVELLKDVTVRLTPLNHDDAREMIRTLKSAPLLAGYRGQKAVAIAALEEALLRVSALVEDLPQIAEMDLNPIIVHATGAAIVDARIRVAPSTPPPAYGFAR